MWIGRLKIYIKANSHSPQQSADSSVDCVTAELEIFLSLCVNSTACHMPQRQMQLVWMSLKSHFIASVRGRHNFRWMKRKFWAEIRIPIKAKGANLKNIWVDSWKVVVVVSHCINKSEDNCGIFFSTDAFIRRREIYGEEFGTNV